MTTPDTNKKILVIEDEPEIRRFLRISLAEQGFVVLTTGEGIEGQELAARENPEVIILDLGLPDVDGMEVLRKIREWSNVPIVIVSARDQEGQKVAALDMGADDYLTKPFGVQELFARIRAALRKVADLPKSDAEVTIGKLRVDLSKRQVFVDGKLVHLSPIEYSLLHELIKGRGAIITQQALLRTVWGLGQAKKTHYLRIYMSNLRKKLEEDPTRPSYIITEPGVGYRLQQDGPES
jgi:two-component system KDP operon response regulator KdpE